MIDFDDLYVKEIWIILILEIERAKYTIVADKFRWNSCSSSADTANKRSCATVSVDLMHFSVHFNSFRSISTAFAIKLFSLEAKPNLTDLFERSKRTLKSNAASNEKQFSDSSNTDAAG